MDEEHVTSPRRLPREVSPRFNVIGPSKQSIGGSGLMAVINLEMVSIK